MGCPKCRAKVGMMKHEVHVGTGVVECTRCVICGYWTQPQPKSIINKVNYAGGARM